MYSVLSYGFNHSPVSLSCHTLWATTTAENKHTYSVLELDLMRLLLKKNHLEGVSDLLYRVWILHLTREEAEAPPSKADHLRPHGELVRGWGRALGSWTSPALLTFPPPSPKGNQQKECSHVTMKDRHKGTKDTSALVILSFRRLYQFSLCVCVIFGKTNYISKKTKRNT